MLRLKSMFCILQSLLFIVSSFSVYDSNFKRWVDRAAFDLTGQTDIEFEKITAGELAVSESEKKLCRDWYENNILTDSSPAYNFTVGGKPLRKNLSDWNIEIGEEGAQGEKYRGGKTAVITLTHKKSGLRAEVEATIYEENATCEWTVYITNNGNSNSPVIKNFYAADCDIKTGTADVCFSKGSEPAADDFELIKSPVCPTSMVFNGNGGRSESALPYLNLSGRNFGVVTANGWTGQWYTSIKQIPGGVRLKQKQEFFDAYLTAGEKVRSPLVSLTFYEGNPLKGFNTFRKWENDCVYPENTGILNCTGFCNEFDTRTADELIASINEMPDSLCEATDFLWMDAGWYKKDNGWYAGVGTWKPDPKRFPDGLKPVSDAAKARGMGLLLWYEPHRCCKGTEVYEYCKQREGWLIEQSDEVNTINFANDDACDYITRVVSASLKENGIGLYRQDYNFQPLSQWQSADKTLYGGRTGITENHYVENCYRFLDALAEDNPGLIIDNCASGGKHLDLEMSRRSVPLWRTDYNCADSNGVNHDDCCEASQVCTYGLSFWFPVTGTGFSIPGEYADRSVLCACESRVGYEDIRECFLKNYFPLDYGAMNTDKYHAVQFGDENGGAALIYRRENVSSESYILKLNGLDEGRTYTLKDYDNPDVSFTLSGRELMETGVEINTGSQTKAIIMTY
ncbi:MAG: alpha-galactosidase [Clostridia bacterium]|nr:alpha-galactosidase [Clostridia bacterium]